MSWNVMFKYRVRTRRMSGVDGLGGNAGDSESDGHVNVKCRPMSLLWWSRKAHLPIWKSKAPKK